MLRPELVSIISKGKKCTNFSLNIIKIFKMFLIVAKLHIFVLLVIAIRKTYGFELRYPIPKQVLETMPNLKSNDYYAGRLSDSWRKNEEQKILENVGRSSYSENAKDPGSAEVEEDAAITTNYEVPVGLDGTEKAVIEKGLDEPGIPGREGSLDLPVKIDKVNSLSTPLIKHDLVESTSSRPRLQIIEEQGSSTEKTVLETQNDLDNPAEPTESIIIDEAVESISTTEKTFSTPDLKKPKKHPTIPVPKTGDLILTRSQAQEIDKNNFNLSKYRWPNRIVPIELSETFNSREKLTILYALDMIENRTCVKFTTRRRSDINYVQVMKSKDKPISSNLGCISGPQVVNLHVANTYDILHEFMHTLGIPHQHSVSKRDEHVKIIMENIRPKLRGQFTKLGEHEDYEYLNDYDLQSIMHFDEYAASKNGNATIVAISGEIEPSSIPTDKDYEKLNKLYKCYKTK